MIRRMVMMAVLSGVVAAIAAMRSRRAASREHAAEGVVAV